MSSFPTHLDWLPPQDKECFCSLRQEPCKLMHQNMFDLIGLLDLDADPNTVDAGFNEHPLILVSRNR
jgi:hypothetical protein